MTVTINGSGTIGGISVGGLNDNIITKNEMATGGAWAPAGTVLQVVQGTYSTSSQTSSTSFVDTGLTVTITPTSATSKILIMSSLCGLYGGSANTYGFQRYTRNGTEIVQFDNIAGYSNNGQSGSNVSFSYLDSPNSTSALTYKQQFRVSSGSGGIIYWQNTTGTNPTSTITLMEIAA